MPARSMNAASGAPSTASTKYEVGGLKVSAGFFDGNSGGTVQTPVPTVLGFEGRTLGICKLSIRIVLRGVFKAFDSRALAVWVRRSDGWRLLALHSGAVVPPS
jgi:hypothetical protein